MKLGPITKRDKGNKATSKKVLMTTCQEILTSFFPNL